MNQKNIINLGKLSLLIILITLGIYLILKPKENDISNFKNDKISVTILTPQKNVVKTNKMIGLILVLSTIPACYLLFKSEKDKRSKIELTPQEKKVLNLIKKGYTNKEMALELNISVSTVKTYINNLYKKKGISSRKELVDS